MTTVDPATLADFNEKQVLITIKNPDGSASQLEGKIEAASEAGIAFREKGKRDPQLVMPDEVEEIALAPTKPKSLPQKKLKEVVETNARQHLLDRHGFGRTQVNAMSDEDALKLHDDIDHTDLGHKHLAEDEDEDDSTDETNDETVDVEDTVSVE